MENGLGNAGFRAGAGGPLPRPEDLVRLGLTWRQSEVLAWLAFGKTDAEIGHILGISSRTVSHTLERIYRKLGVATQTHTA
jgi:DNA-binding CsgD family transcriptional regulator